MDDLTTKPAIGILLTKIYSLPGLLLPLDILSQVCKIIKGLETAPREVNSQRKVNKSMSGIITQNTLGILTVQPEISNP